MDDIQLNRKQAYLSMYGFLEVLWSENQELFPNGLPSLLGDTNPFFWDDGKSADPAMYEDWARVWGENVSHSSEEVYEIARRFIVFYNGLYLIPDPELVHILNHWESSEYKDLWTRIYRIILDKNL